VIVRNPQLVFVSVLELHFADQGGCLMDVRHVLALRVGALIGALE